LVFRVKRPQMQTAVTALPDAVSKAAAVGA